MGTWKRAEVVVMGRVRTERLDRQLQSVFAVTAGIWGRRPGSKKVRCQNVCRRRSHDRCVFGHSNGRDTGFIVIRKPSAVSGRNKFIEARDAELMLELEKRGLSVLCPAHQWVDRPNLRCPAGERDSLRALGIPKICG